MVDITERKRREEQIAKLTRLYAVLSQVNEAIVRTRDAAALFREVCRIVAETGVFPLVWIGEVRGQEVHPVASSGSGTDYLRHIRVEVQGTLGKGPTGTCIRENRAVVNDDFAHGASTAPWREAAMQYGFRASAAFPLCRQGKAIGALTLYAGETNAFDAEQVGLLESLTADLSYALDALDHSELRDRAEQAMRESESRYRSLFTTMSEGFALHEMILDADGRPCDYRFLEVNPAFERATGLKAADIVGHALSEVLPNTESVWLQRYGRVVLTGEPDHFEEYHQQTGRWYEVFASRTAAREFAVVFLNVTERKRAEAALRESEERFRLALRNAPVSVSVQDRELRYIWAYNQRTARPEDIIGKFDTDLFTPEEAERLRAIKRRVLEEDVDIRRQMWLDRPGGRIFLDVYFEPIHDSAGRVTGVGCATVDLTPIKLAEEALAAAKSAADAANEAKSQFLANMSHELRTPMNAILGMLDVALPKAADPTVVDCLQTAKGSADLLLTLLNDLLDSAKIESGKLQLESAPFSLRRSLDQMAHVLSARASEKGLCFRCQVHEATPDAVVGDRMRLQQVLLNLAGNAIKFTERGEVEVSLRHTAARRADTRRRPIEAASLPRAELPSDDVGELVLEFVVRDTGIGIPPACLERLFQPFCQADASMSRRFGGTGLGLSISKSLVEMMGGRIWAESEVGRGSKFYFTVRLPLAQQSPVEFESPRVVPTLARTLRILLVEDNPANQRFASYMLEDRGHTVEIAVDGHEAIRLSGKNCYDVILMDVQMPGMDGLEATAAIRKREAERSQGIASRKLTEADEPTACDAPTLPTLQSAFSSRRVPIIAMTAHAMSGDRDRCLAAGMDGYLSKPVDVHEMIALVESVA